ncbi:MAG: SDR family oxidoreductase [Phycisphaerales bacterium]|nr:SDR family oxidoreductase [Phycisphaerales bacterium]
MSIYLVTGGAGFIGSHLVTRLVELGRKVRVLDNFSSGRRGNLAHVEGRYELIEGDMRDPAVCQRACSGVEVVFHEAAVPSVPLSVEKPEDSHTANINGTFNLLLAAKNRGVRRFVYAASSSAYGDTPELPKRESMTPNPKSPYAVQKLVGEHYARAFHECYGLETISLRYFNVFGPRQNPKSQYAAAIPAFVTAILRDESPVVYGDGEQTRDFTYIDNVVEGNLLAASAKRTCGEAVNLACGDRISVNEVIARINGILGKRVPTKHLPERAGDVKHSCADITSVRELLGFAPIVSFEEGLRRAIQFYQTSTG